MLPELAEHPPPRDCKTKKNIEYKHIYDSFCAAFWPFDDVKLRDAFRMSR